MTSAHTPIKKSKSIFSVLVLLLLALAIAATPGLASSDPATSVKSQAKSSRLVYAAKSAQSPAGIPILGVTQQWSVAAPDGNPQDEFGYSVAIDGNTAVVGARNANPNTGGGALENAGSAYVYVYDGKTWILQDKLVAKDAAPYDSFGVSVAISGNFVLVGASGVDIDDEDNAGAAYVFGRSGDAWEQYDKLVSDDPKKDDTLGTAVALYGDLAVVAADSKDLLPLVDAGTVYVYKRSGSRKWAQQATVVSSTPGVGDYFGSSLALQGNTLVVGSSMLNPYTQGSKGGGKVEVFTRSGSSWIFRTALEPEGLRSGDGYGSAVALYSNWVVAGAPFSDPDLGAGRVTGAGSAYVFKGSGSSWKEEDMLIPEGGSSFEQFGDALGIYRDTIVVGAEGAWQAGEDGAGAVYIFARDGNAWDYQTRAVADPAYEGDAFGVSVAISRDWFVAGANGRDSGRVSQTGEAFLDRLGTVVLPDTGFAPSQVTYLEQQPADKAYSEYGDMWLEIPALDQRMTIIGVPTSGNGWDVRWLGDRAGYMEGTAFPTWQGNTGLAGHTTLANGNPGPFAGLETLRWGERVTIHAWGQRYIYEVRENKMVLPGELAVLKHEELDWVTLITCESYDESTGTYRWRRIVRAVLVSVGQD